jgi:hypothetical protein
VVRRSQTSNPRSAVVLTAGADWRTRAALERRGNGAEFPQPRKQSAKLKALERILPLIRATIKAKRWHQVRFALSHAQALINALPAEQTTEQRRQLAELRKKFAARNTPLAKQVAKAKAAASAKKQPPKKKTSKKQAPTPARRKAAPRSAIPDLGDRYINRAALGYSSEPSATNRTKGAQPARPTAKGARDRSLESRT